MNAYIYAPPIILAVAVMAIIWGVRRVRRLTQENKQASRVSEQQMLTSIGLMPTGWAEAEDDAIVRGVVTPTVPRPLPVVLRNESGAPRVSPRPPKIPWTVPMIGKPPVPPPTARSAVNHPPA